MAKQRGLLGAHKNYIVKDMASGRTIEVTSQKKLAVLLGTNAQKIMTLEKKSIHSFGQWTFYRK